MLFQLYNKEQISLYLQLKNDDTFALVSKEGKEYLALKKGDLGQRGQDGQGWQQRTSRHECHFHHLVSLLLCRQEGI